VSDRGSSSGLREIHTNGFLDRVKALTDRSLDSSLLFVLGAGASRQSGIKTGDEMVSVTTLTFSWTCGRTYSTAEALVARSLEIDPSDTDDFCL
jgi:hypothetical protein